VGPTSMPVLAFLDAPSVPEVSVVPGRRSLQMIVVVRLGHGPPPWPPRLGDSVVHRGEACTVVATPGEEETLFTVCPSSGKDRTAVLENIIPAPPQSAALTHRHVEEVQLRWEGAGGEIALLPPVAVDHTAGAAPAQIRVVLGPQHGIAPGQSYRLSARVGTPQRTSEWSGWSIALTAALPDPLPEAMEVSAEVLGRNSARISWPRFCAAAGVVLEFRVDVSSEVGGALQRHSTAHTEVGPGESCSVVLHGLFAGTQYFATVAVRMRGFGSREWGRTGLRVGFTTDFARTGEG